VATAAGVAGCQTNWQPVALCIHTGSVEWPFRFPHLHPRPGAPLSSFHSFIHCHPCSPSSFSGIPAALSLMFNPLQAATERLHFDFFFLSFCHCWMPLLLFAHCRRD